MIYFNQYGDSNVMGSIIMKKYKKAAGKAAFDYRYG